MLTRNKLLAGAAALVALALVGPANAQAPIKLGELNSYKVFPAFLEPYKKGWELAVEEVNAAGGVLGRKIEVVSRDDNGNPGDAVRVAEELLSREGASILIGTFPSNVGLAVADFAKQTQGAVHRRRAADRQDRVGRRQRLHLPPAHLDLHADGDADSRCGQAEEEALGHRLSQLRIRPVGDGGLQEADEGEAAGRRVRHRAGHAARQDRRRRRGPGAGRRQARRDLLLAVRSPTSPSSCAKASSAASSRASRCSISWPASPSISTR